MLMGSDDGGVDHGVFVVGVIGQGLEKTLPNPCLRPTGEPGVIILPGAEALRQIAPGRSRTKLPNQSFNKNTVAPLAIAPNVAGATRQQRFDPRKLIVPQSVTFHPKALRRKAPHESKGFCVVARRTTTGSVASLRDHIEA